MRTFDRIPQCLDGYLDILKVPEILTGFIHDDTVVLEVLQTFSLAIAIRIILRKSSLSLDRTSTMNGRNKGDFMPMKLHVGVTFLYEVVRNDTPRVLEIDEAFSSDGVGEESSSTTTGGRIRFRTRATNDV